MELEPGDVQAHADLGAPYAALSRFEQAETQFREALRRDPGTPSALTGLLHKLDCLAGLVLDLAPNAYELRYVLGSACMKAGRYAEAAGAFEAALKAGGADPEIYYRMARAYAKFGRHAKANYQAERAGTRPTETARGTECVGALSHDRFARCGAFSAEMTK